MGKIKGFESALEALRALDSKSQARILADILKKDPQMAEKLKKNLIVFEDLLSANPQGLSKLFQSVPDPRWVMALRGKNKEFVDSILKILPQRRADLLKAALDHLGPQPLTKVEAAQKEILEKAFELEAQGLILFQRGHDPLV
ncbi:MAG: FliG C-terminal domain-containing protein [Pseudobdellovibrionaceae bacterium]